jgi:hypothetical protein
MTYLRAAWQVRQGQVLVDKCWAATTLGHQAQQFFVCLLGALFAMAMQWLVSLGEDVKEPKAELLYGKP